jgi:hypothetical protein
MSQNWRGNDWTASNWDGNNWLGPNDEAPPGAIFANLTGSGSLNGNISVTPVQPDVPVPPSGGNTSRKHRYTPKTSVFEGPDDREKAQKVDEEEVMWLISNALQHIFDEETMWEA